ncbi:TonB-dependent siderophore receptor [Acidobacteria bacterium AB60]|nr:TonB-dependent siderophore receptor [Acidobacteria bacterium AB60]
MTAPAEPPNQLEPPRPVSGQGHARAWAFVILVFAGLSMVAVAQDPASGPAGSPQPQLPHPTTTVEVHADTQNTYLPDTVTAGTLDGAPLKDTPLSVSVITRGVLTDQQARVLTDVVKNDASVGEDYAPVGYYGDFEIRGFPIDLATGLQINGLTIAGEQDVPLENKERVEIVKGIAGVESGITSAGGLIDFVTKRPAAIEAFDLATDHRGTSFGAVDLGHLFGRRRQFGVRFNAAGEDIHTYVEDANGWRAMGSAAADWSINPATTLRTDFEYQHKVERSEAGYQLLGGTTVPIGVHPSTMLGDQSWSKPNTFDAFNAGARVQRLLGSDWTASLSGSYSHSLIDDNVIYPYGAAYDAEGNDLCPDAPYWFFCPDGSYSIYDYRSPGELRIDALGEALAVGRLKTGALTHNLAFGGSMFDRSVDLSPTIVYAWIGNENIYQPSQPVSPEIPYLQAGPSVLADYNRQVSGLLQDRVDLPGRVSVMAGARYASVKDFNYTGARGEWLPQYAVTYAPVAPLNLYVNYGQLLSLGPQAPFWVTNASAYLAPYFTRQVEAGAKYEADRHVLVTGAYFRMRAPFFYPQGPDENDNFTFVSQGHETHDGVELSAQGKVASGVQVNGSVAMIRAHSTDTGTPAFDGKQVINVPRVRTAVSADIALPHAGGLHLLPGWSYTSSKEATRDDAVSVPGYNLFNLGARYTPGGERGRMTLRLFADNITDKRYWKDTGASFGDTFIHQGAPTTVRLSAHYTF